MSSLFSFSFWFTHQRNRATTVWFVAHFALLLFLASMLMTGSRILLATTTLQETSPAMFNPVLGWFPPTNDLTTSIAWGDMNGDGFLDLAVGNLEQPSKVYLNQDGVLQSTPVWTAPANDDTWSIAWGDMNGDGTLDLAVGNFWQPSKVYLNQGGILQNAPTWTGPTNSRTLILTWGDMNGDGYLDLAIGGQPSKVYLNQNGMLQTTPAWIAPTNNNTYSMSWGDMNSDGTLDLAIGEGPNKVYLNQNGMLQTTPAWIAPTNDNTHSMSWGDMNSDGALDLAVGNETQASKVYLNQGDTLQTTPIWTGPISDNSWNVAWGDMNSDGMLDLVVGGITNKVYLNQGGVLLNTPTWTAPVSDSASSLALGDMNSDGMLDLALGAVPNRVYLNQGGALHSTSTWTASTNDKTWNIAWGDMNGDGLLDLAVGNWQQPSKVYLNQNGVLQTTPTWSSLTNDSTSCIAWGDMNGDGLLDLAVGNKTKSSSVYLNHDGILQTTPAWNSLTNEGTRSIAWGDMNGDGALDLAIGSYENHTRVYLNQNGMLHTTPAWTAPTNDLTRSVAWGDMNGDGALDLAVGNYAIDNWERPSKVYLNQGGTLQTTPVWTAPMNDGTWSIAWGDMNGDGTLDLAVGNGGQPSKVYLNHGGILQTFPTWTSMTNDYADSIAWGDINGDGTLDLAVGSSNNQPNKVYLNQGGMLQSFPVWTSLTGNDTSSIALGDMNGDGTVDLAVGSTAQPNKIYLMKKTVHPVFARPLSIFLSPFSNPELTFNGGTVTTLAPANFYAQSAIRQSGQVSLTYHLFHPIGEPIRSIRVYYSLNGSVSGKRSEWREAKPVLGTQTTDLSSSPYPTHTITNTHTFVWDVFGSGFFGQSDNVVVRIEALPNLKPVRNGVPGPFQRGYISTQSFPFRVRGSQVRVVQSGNLAKPASNAVVYRLPANQVADANPFVGLNGTPYQTNSQGYLQGRGALSIGDRLIALQPITSTRAYTLYQTSAPVTLTGLDAFTMTQGGVQTLTVSPANQLLLFNLTISLEWDARNDSGYLAQLENDLRRTSQLLFDLSNGQAALGDIAIYHDKGNWGLADVIITASNNQRPSAIMGGVVTTGTADVDLIGATIADAYVPGQVRMGATWNRFGEAGGTLGEDWPRTLAHELGHYLFFLSDDYIGVTPDKKTMKIVDCVGSAMTDPYEEGYSEFLATSQWTGECLDTTAARYLGRSDWQSIKKFYPFLRDAPVNNGPNQLPLAVTRIQTFAPPTATQTLAAPFFRLVDASNATLIVPNGRGQAYLLKRQGNNDPTDDYLINLGTPVGDLVQARGAAPGDRLCVFDFSQPALRLGCLESVGATASPVVLQKVSDWQPQVQITGISSNTVVVTVTNVATGNLSVQLLPALGVASSEVTMTRQITRFVQAVTAVDGAYYGYVRIWVPGSTPRKELIVEYNAVEAWGGRVRAHFWATPSDAWGGRLRVHFWAAPAVAWGGRVRLWGAPVMSNDGQVSIFSLDNPYANDPRYTLQTVAFPPSLPAWLTPVGQAYRLSSNSTLPPSSILFNYLDRDVPAGYENNLRVYFQKEGQQTWQALTNQLDKERNAVTAQVQGVGIYLLIATVEIKPRLTFGWNDIGYTIQTTQTISDGLAAIQGKYSIAKAFFPQLAKPWLTYDPKIKPPFDKTVNTLKQLEYGHGYWIYATQAVTLYLDVSPASIGAAPLAIDLATEAPPAPAEFYGWVFPTDGISLTAGMSLTAQIDGILCGETTLEVLDDGQFGYQIQVVSKDADETPACGESGKLVTFTLAAMPMAQIAWWDNTQTQQVDLGAGVSSGIPRVYLPLVSR